MLAEVLYRVTRPRIFTAVLLAVMMLGGCEWDGAGQQLDAETFSESEETTIAEDIESADVVFEAKDGDTPEDTAKAIFAEWLDRLAKGDSESAEELVAKRAGAVGTEFRLFNVYYPGDADIVYFAPSVITQRGSSTVVRLKATVSPKEDPQNKVNAEIMVRVTAQGKAVIEYISEIGSSATFDRNLDRRASLAYDIAQSVYDKLEKKPGNGMHHMGDGSQMTETVKNRLCPSDTEDFSIAVRDGKVMYVSWSDGIYSQRFPRAQLTDGQIKLG